MEVREADEAFSSPVDAGLLDLVHARAATGVEALLAGDAEKPPAAVKDLLWLLAKALSRRRHEVALATARALATVYSSPQADDQLRVDIAAGVSALGGLAVRLEAWRLVRRLALLPSGGRREARQQPYLVPDGRLRLARQSSGQRNADRSLIDLAATWTSEHHEGRPELPAGDERLLDSICQFNALASLIHFASGSDSGFPEFRRYESRRTDLVVETVVIDPTIRDQVLPGIDDRRLAALLVQVATVHKNYFWEFGAWPGFESRAVVDFIAANAPS